MKTRNASATSWWPKCGSSVIAVFMLLAVVLACGRSSPNCTGEVNHLGETYTGKGKNADEAQQFACNNYCIEADSEFDAMYRIWLDSPKGKAAGSPSKKESIYKDSRLLDYVTLTCAIKCVASVKQGTLKGTAKCS